MWNDQPVQRKAPPLEMPPPTRAFLSQFNRSFTPPALINDPYAVDRKLTITPLLVGTRPNHAPKNPFAIDPAIERICHYIGPEDVSDPDFQPSPKMVAINDEEWVSEHEDSSPEEQPSTIRRNSSLKSDGFGASNYPRKRSTEVGKTSEIKSSPQAVGGQRKGTSVRKFKNISRVATFLGSNSPDADISIHSQDLPFYGVRSPCQSDGKSWDEWEEPGEASWQVKRRGSHEHHVEMKYVSLL